MTSEQAATVAARRRQWKRLVETLDKPPPWWESPLDKIKNLARNEHPGLEELVESFRALSDRFGIDRRHQQQWNDVREILRTENEPSAPDSSRVLDNDAPGIVVLTRPEQLWQSLKRGGLFALEVELKNTGSSRWSDRMLFRLGPSVNSALPFTPGLLPVPDTDAGERCSVLIPGRAQWFSGLAVISYVMVSADCSVVAPGHLRCYVDTRKVDGRPVDRSTAPSDQA